MTTEATPVEATPDTTKRLPKSAQDEVRDRISNAVCDLNCALIYIGDNGRVGRSAIINAISEAQFAYGYFFDKEL